MDDVNSMGDMRFDHFDGCACGASLVTAVRVSEVAVAKTGVM